MNIHELLAPLNIEHFVQDTWGAHVTHLPATARRSAEADLISHEWSRALVRYRPIEDGALAPELGASAAGTPAAGTTLSARRIDRSLKDVAQTCASLRHDLAFAVTANAYVTPAGAADGFDWHTDPHHVLAFQVSGNKRWTYMVDGEHVGSVLRPGDVLYVPSNRAHIAAADPGGSFHITYGIHALTWNEIHPACAVSEEVQPGLLAPRAESAAVQALQARLPTISSHEAASALERGRKQLAFEVLFRS